MSGKTFGRGVVACQPTLPPPVRTRSGVVHKRNRMKQFARRLPLTLFFQVLRVLQAAGVVAAAAGVMSLGGCASSTDASLIHLPDGQSGYAINCSGADASTTWASCYVMAGDKCGATGYTIVSKDNEEGGPSGGSITNVLSANGKNPSMVLRCN